MSRREWLALGLAVLVALASAGAVSWRRERAERAFERELAFLQDRGGALTPQDVVAAALRLPRDRFLVKVLEKRLGERGRARLLAATAVEYWDASPRDDGVLPRPEHHAGPIRELLPLLPAIARAQRDEADPFTADACLVCVWDRTTLEAAVWPAFDALSVEEQANKIEGTRKQLDLLKEGSNIYRAKTQDFVSGQQTLWMMRMHRELLGVLLDRDPRPRTKDGFAGLVYGYADDRDVVAAVGSLCAATPR